MSKKKDLLIQEEIDKCLRYFSDNNNKSAQEQFLRLLQEMQITLEEPIVEDSITGTRIRFTYTTAISRKGGGIDEGVIKFQYMKEIPVDYSKVPLELRDNITAASTVNDTISHNNNNAIEEEDTIIESYDELEKSIPSLCEVLGLLKKIYFMPEDFSNRLVVDRIHKLRDMFSKDEILTFPSIDLSDNAGLIPI
ncbi:MAG: hypothetical protein M3136_03665 [Thermoproteota archaeon]|jgi:hypothetical protein|nr:hypothetical protein [Thermoproteota archaeon]